MLKLKMRKNVEAVCITKVDIDYGEGKGKNYVPKLDAMLTPFGDVDKPIHVDAAYVAREKPEVGGYYVKEEDGRESFYTEASFEKYFK